MASSEPTLGALLALAMQAAWAGGRKTLAYFNNGTPVEIKGDGSPVTAADRDAEAEIRRLITAAFPGHGILGEEEGERAGDGEYRWIIDPIDGTLTFVQGVPLYGTLIGLEVRGEPSLGVIYMPALDEMVAAARGLGCTWNGRPARVSGVNRLDQAFITVTSEFDCRQRSSSFQQLADLTRLQRTWADCYGYVLVATGRAEIAVDPRMHIWDCAPLLPIVEEAGGRFTNWAGERTIDGGDAVATNGPLHARVLEVLGRE